jgi:hypothetical protein
MRGRAARPHALSEAEEGAFYPRRSKGAGTVLSCALRDVAGRSARARAPFSPPRVARARSAAPAGPRALEVDIGAGARRRSARDADEADAMEPTSAAGLASAAKGMLERSRRAERE